MIQAVIQYAGHQYLVNKGSKVTIDKYLGQKPGTSINIKEVLLLIDEDKATVGQPTIKTASVVVKVLEEKKGKKVVVKRYKSKSRYRRAYGHRQPQTVLEVTAIKTK